MKIILISPTWKIQAKEKRMERGKVFKFPQLSLLAVAAVTPPEVETELIDENVEEIDFNKEADLVGITCMTATAPRAYEIADRFREKGISVVLGGMHPSALPQEAIQHADAVVIGEAEPTWPRLIEDFKRGGKGTLKPFYGDGRRVDLSQICPPRRSLLKRNKYIITRVLQVSRGCPFDCSFCSVSKFFGKKYRLRPIKDVVAEIKSLVGKSLYSRFIAFLDDNIMGNVKYAKELFRALIPYKLVWVGQASVNVAQDPELLELAANSGCKGLFVGFESISPSSLREADKPQNKISFYKKAIERFHRFGISLEGAFIFGFDNDDKSIFKKTVNFIKKVKLDAVQFGILTPFPGTRLFSKLSREGRIIDHDWSNYDIANVVFKPKLMTPQELKKGFTWAYQHIYSFPGIFRRLSGMISGKRWRYFGPLLTVNLAYRRIFKGAKRAKDPAKG
ncbi:Bacteriochlorophyllide d C-12(1)-methyltransferase [subsurface metagenome]